MIRLSLAFVVVSALTGQADVPRAHPSFSVTGVSQATLIETKPKAVKRKARVNRSRRVIRTDRAPQAIGPYSQAIRFGNLVFTAGQIGVDPKTGEFAGSGIREQTEQVLKNLVAVLEAAGSSPKNVLKTTVFLADMDDFSAMNEVYRSYFSIDPPARSTVQVARLPRNARVEIEAVALVGKD